MPETRTAKDAQGRQALAQIRAKSGAVRPSELRLHFGDAIPGLVGAVAQDLGITSPEVIAACRSGQLLYSDIEPAARRLVEDA